MQILLEWLQKMRNGFEEYVTRSHGSSTSPLKLAKMEMSCSLTMAGRYSSGNYYVSADSLQRVFLIALSLYIYLVTCLVGC
jgi:hypothetical protein